MNCPVCGNTGYITVEYPVFTNGSWSDVEQMRERCNCNPEPPDPDEPVDDGSPYFSDWEDFHKFNDARYEGM